MDKAQAIQEIWNEEKRTAELLFRSRVKNVLGQISTHAKALMEAKAELAALEYTEPSCPSGDE